MLCALLQHGTLNPEPLNLHTEFLTAHMHRRYAIQPGHGFFESGRNADQGSFIAKWGGKLHPDRQTGFTLDQRQGDRRRPCHIEQPHVLKDPEIILPEFIGFQIIPLRTEKSMWLRQYG